MALCCNMKPNSHFLPPKNSKPSNRNTIYNILRQHTHTHITKLTRQLIILDTISQSQWEFYESEFSDSSWCVYHSKYMHYYWFVIITTNQEQNLQQTTAQSGTVRFTCLRFTKQEGHLLISQCCKKEEKGG